MRPAPFLRLLGSEFYRIGTDAPLRRLWIFALAWHAASSLLYVLARFGQLGLPAGIQGVSSTFGAGFMDQELNQLFLVLAAVASLRVPGLAPEAGVSLTRAYAARTAAVVVLASGAALLAALVSFSASVLIRPDPPSMMEFLSRGIDGRPIDRAVSLANPFALYFLAAYALAMAVTVLLVCPLMLRGAHPLLVTFGYFAVAQVLTYAGDSNPWVRDANPLAFSLPRRYFVHLPQDMGTLWTIFGVPLLWAAVGVVVWRAMVSWREEAL